MKKLTIAIIIIVGSQLFSQIQLLNAFPNLTFNNPVDLQSPKDSTNRIFVVEQSGVIRVFQNSSSASASKVFLDISSRIVSGGETGLLGLAFHPNYKNNGYFYIDYTTYTQVSTSLTSRVSRFKVSSTNPDSADERSETFLLEQEQPFSNHNGGQIRFGPDGFLYIAFGDGGSAGDPNNNAQNKSTFLGKILRIDIDGGNNYTIPTDNPFVNNTQGYKEEIYAVGLRNPWRFSFDSVTGWLWCGDVGQDTWEEIDIIQNGLNYGWRCYEGNHPYNTDGCSDNYTSPIFEYEHLGGNCSITGGFVYRGTTVPELFGKYIYADYCSKKFWSLQYDSTAQAINEFLFTATTGSPVAFGTDNNNELYVCTFDGDIYKFKSTAVNISEASTGEFNFSLGQNYPNPFNPSTEITYSIAKNSFVSLRVFDILGNLAANLVNENKEKGIYSVTFTTAGLASGVYFYVLKAADYIESKKMVILK